MIRPAKYMRLEQCVLRVAALLLEHLRELLVLPMAELEGLVSTRLGDAALVNLLDALNALFLLGLLEYNMTTDTLVYNEPVPRARS